MESRHTWADVHAASGRLQHRNQLGKARRKGNGNRHPEDEARHADQVARTETVRTSPI